MSRRVLGSNVQGALLSLTAFGIFATHDVVVKLLGGTYAPFQILFFSVLLGFPILSFLLLRDTEERNLIPRHPYWTGLRTLTAVLTGVCAFYAFSTLPLAQAYAILFTSPLLITVIAIPVLGEKVGIHRAGAVVLGLVGVIVVLQPGATALSLGHGAALVAAVASAFSSVVVRKIGRDERSVVLLIYPMMANFLLMGIALPFVYVPMPLVDLGAVAVVALFGFVATFILIRAYKVGEAAIVAPMQYSQILWASVFGLLFFDEGIAGTTILGTGIIVLSGLYIVFRESRTGASDNTPVLRTRSRAETGTTPRVGPLMRAEDERDTDETDAR